MRWINPSQKMDKRQKCFLFAKSGSKILNLVTCLLDASLKNSL